MSEKRARTPVAPAPERDDSGLSSSQGTMPKEQEVQTKKAEDVKAQVDGLATAEPAIIPAYNFSFAMGGWLMIYNFGVAKCLLDHELHKVQPERQTVIGSSAGSLAAAALVLEADIDKIVEQTKTSFIPRAHAANFFGLVYGMFHISTFLKESMLSYLPIERVPEKTTPRGRLIVVMTSLLGWKSVRADEFEHGEELFDALRCSCAVLPFVMPHRFRGKVCLDGYFSEGTSPPSLDEEDAGELETVTISPFYASRATIRPSRYVPLSWIALAPNDPCAIDWLYDLGYRDALFWMAKKGIAHTCSHDTRFAKHGREVHAAASPETISTTALERSGSGSSGRDSCGDHPPMVAQVLPSMRVTSGHIDALETPLELPSPYTDEDRRGGRFGGGARDGTAWDEGLERNSTKNEDIPSEASNGDSGSENEGQARVSGAKGSIGEHYVRKSFVLSCCKMRPRRERHPKLDEPVFVPSLEHFVGLGSYHSAVDFLFLVFFNVVWRPAAALCLYMDLFARLNLAVARGARKELGPLLWWQVPSFLLGVVVLERKPSPRDWVLVLIAVAAVVAVRGRREGAPSKADWLEARNCVRGLLEYRILLSCLTFRCWDNNIRSEALESSLLYRTISFFM